MCLSLWYISLFFFFSLYLPLCLCVFSFGPPTQDSRFNSEGFLVNHTWNLPLSLNALPRQRVLPRSVRAVQERVPLIIPVIGFSNAEAVIYMRWHSVQTCRPLQPFSGKQLTAPLSRLPPSHTLFFSLATPLPLSLFLWLLSSHKQRRFTAKRVRGVQGGVAIGVFSVASDYLLVNWQLFFVVDIQKGVG